MTTRKKPNRRKLSLRVDEETYATLSRIAENSDRPLSYIASYFLDLGIEADRAAHPEDPPQAQP